MGCCSLKSAKENDMTPLKTKPHKIRLNMESHYIPLISTHTKPEKSLKIVSLNILAQHLIEGECPAY
jgi:hypothetical protein